MRVIKKDIVFLLIAILTVCTIAEVIKFGIYDNYPLVYMDGNCPKGIYVEIINEIAERENWKVQFVYMEWSELFKALLEKKIDFITAIAETPERMQLYGFNREAFIQNWGVLISTHKIADLFFLKDKKLGLVRNDVYAKELLEILESFNINVDVVYYQSYEDEIKDLEKGKIFSAVVSRLAAVTLSGKYNFEVSSFIFKPVNLKIAYLYGSKKGKSIAKTIDSYLSKWKKDENSPYWKIIDRYLNTPYKFPEWLKLLLMLIIVALGVFFMIILVQFVISKRLKRALRVRTEDLERKSKELEEINAELENSYRELSELMSKSMEMVKIIADIVDLELPEEEFMQKILEVAIKFLSPAKYGSIFVLDEKRYPHIVTAVGHNKEMIKNHRFRDTSFFIAPDEPLIVKDIIKHDESRMKPEDFEIMKKATKPMKESLIAPIMEKDKVIGTIVIDIPKESEGSFTKFHVTMMENFGKILQIFISYRKFVEMEKNFHKSIVLVLSKALDFYSPYTKGHSERVAEISVKIAKALKLPKETIEKIYWASILHDVGKIFVPQDILNKPGKLTNEEYNLIKLHPVKSYELIKEVQGLENIAEIVKHHHEHWDGTGYPDGLKGENIPFESRIIAIADAYDAMTSKRPYREALTPEEAVEEIKRYAGTQFDPYVVKYFLIAMENNEEIA